MKKKEGIYMIFQYKNYEKENEALNSDELKQIHEDMVKEIGEDKQALSLYDQIIQASIDYIGIRTKWALLDKESRKEINDQRTKKHNAVIDSFDNLASYLKSQGNQSEWRDRIGYEKDGKYYRKRIGDMGCYIAFLISLSTR